MATPEVCCDVKARFPIDRLSILCRMALALLPLFCVPPLFSQILPFRRYTTEDGLSSNYTLALSVDSLGALWIGSEEGLSRYDGISFQNYTIADGLGFSRVNCLVRGARGGSSVWVGTNGGGVTHVQRGVFSNYRLGTSQWSNIINALTLDREGTLWAGTTEGVYRFVGGRFLPVDPGKKLNNVMSLQVSPAGILWIVTERQVAMLTVATGNIRSVALPRERDETFQTAFVDSGGSVWIGTSEGRMLHLRGKHIVETLRDPARGRIFFFLRDQKGSLWVGTSNGLLRIRDRFSRILSYTQANGLPDGAIVQGTLDHEGDLWLATASGGIAKLSNYHLVTFHRSASTFSPNNATAVSDSMNHVWAVSEEGLWEYRQDPGMEWVGVCHVELAPPAGIVPITLVLTDSVHFWVGFSNGRLSEYRIQYRTETFSHLTEMKRFLPDRELPKGTAMFLAQDHLGHLWCSMANDKGIIVLDPRSTVPLLQRLMPDDGLPDASVRAIYQDHNEHLWLGGFVGGLAEFSRPDRAGSVHELAGRGPLPNRSIRAILEDNRGSLWVGMRYGGLASIHDGIVRTFSLDDGLLSDAIWCLARTGEGRLWVGTQMGIELFDPVTLQTTTRQELTGSPVWGCGETAAGSLWYLSASGLTFYDYREDAARPVHPPVSISRFEVNGVPMTVGGDHVLSSEQNHCMIEVRGISLRDEQRVRYKYLLEGGGTAGWQPLNADRTVLFAALAPGSYTLYAKAVTGDGVESDPPAVLHFTILRPVWLRWWFLSASICLILMTVALLVRLRVRRLLAIERIRNRIAADLHDDIGSGLTRIAILSDVARRQTGNSETSSAQTMERVSNMARELMETITDVVWSIDPSHEPIERLIQRLRSFAYELCDAKRMTLAFTVPEDVLRVRITSDVSRNLLLLVKEALTNIAKHAQCRHVEVTFRTSSGALEVTITDDGVGFDVASAREGNGLVNMQKRAASAGGTFVLESSRSKGTAIRAAFPLQGRTAYLGS